MERKKLVIIGVGVTLIAGLFLMGVYHIGNHLINMADRKMAYHRQELVAGIDRVTKELNVEVKNTLQDEEVQKAFENFLWEAYSSETGEWIQGQANGKINHLTWILLGLAEEVYKVRPQFVDYLKERNPEGSFPTHRGSDIYPDNYKFHPISEETPEAEVKPPEASEEIVEGTPTEKKIEEITPKEAPSPAPDNSAIEETKKLLEGM